jgi:hypothetical protein
MFWTSDLVLVFLQQATLVLRETIVLAAFYLTYHKVDAFCRFLYRYVT